MNWRAVIFFVVAAFLLVPGVAAAQAQGEDDGFVLRVNGVTTVGANETIDGVVAISGDVVVDGRLTGGLWVIDGVASVNGTVGGDVMVIDGTLDLASGATVENVTLVRSELNQAPGATITGELSERSEFVHFGWGWTAFSVLFWIGTTLVVLAAGLAFAALAGRQLAGAGGTLTTRAGESIVTALVLWVGLPILTVVAFLTVVGIPLGIAILVVVLPALWVLGYLVAGARLGVYLARLLGRPAAGERPYLATALGLIAFQVIGLVPFLGGLVVGLAGLAGSGALVYRTYADRRKQRPATAAVRREPAPAA